MAERQSNPLFTSSERRRGRVARAARRRHGVRHHLKGFARAKIGGLLGIPLNRDMLTGKGSRRGAHGSAPTAGHPEKSSYTPSSSAVRRDVIEALRGQGYSRKVAQQMTPAAESGDNFESLFRRAMAKNPGELIIFGNPATAYTRRGIGLAAMKQGVARVKNSIPSAILDGLAIGAGLHFSNRIFGRNPIPLAVLQGLGWEVGETVGKKVLSVSRRRKRNVAGSVRLSSAQLRLRNMAFEWMSDHASEYESAQMLAQAASTKYEFPVSGLIETARRIFDANRAGNPSTLDRAGQLFKDFHHREASGVFETHRSAKMRKDFTILGPLVAIGVNAEVYDRKKRSMSKPAWEDYKVEHFDKLPHMAFMTNANIAFVKRVLDDPSQYVQNAPQLASSPNGRQLYAITPDGVHPSFVRSFDTDTSKDFIDLGEATFVVYIAKKPDRAVEWVHELGEDGGTRPRLMYDRLKRELFFIGGSYKVEAPGILN